MDTLRSKVGIALLITCMVILIAVIWYCVLQLLNGPSVMEGTFVEGVHRMEMMVRL